MADTKISALTAVTTPTAASELAVNEGGTSKKLTLEQMRDFVEAATSVRNAATATQTPAANTDTYITNSNLLIPTGRLQAKTMARWRLSITKGAAGTGTPTFNIRVGTSGSGAVGDASRCLFTWPAANTAAADEMEVDITATFRSVGSGTSAVIQGQLRASHELTTTGFGGTALGANIIMNTTGGGFDSTTAVVIGLSNNGGTASAWSILQVHAELLNLT
jgi:hypothetical protein